MIFGIAFHENSSFPKKVHVRKPHDSCSRIGVREGSPKKKEINKKRKSYKKYLQKQVSKKDAKMKKHLPKVIQKRGKHDETTFKKRSEKNIEKIMIMPGAQCDP